jgi:hypothetical protein
MTWNGMIMIITLVRPQGKLVLSGLDPGLYSPDLRCLSVFYKVLDSTTSILGMCI